VPPGVGTIVWADELWGGRTARAGAARADDLAYVLYTSGSTGKPKGVMVTHRAVTNLLGSLRVRPGLRAEDVWLAVTTLSFDVSVAEILLPLTVGARVVVASSAETRDGVLLGALIERTQATVMGWTPSGWRLLLASGWNGRKGLKALTAGEPLPRDLADQLLQRVDELWNMYGPTETTVYSTGCPVSPAAGRVLIGRPVANTRVYVLDRSLQPTPVGVPGELCIGGTGLARGYLGRPDLTAERFVPDPFSTEAGARIYRTGDVVRFTPDGDLEHLGRNDGQVKLRGFRLELGEVESVLQEHPQIARAICRVLQRGADDARLDAYLVPVAGGVPTEAELRLHVRERLPEYMVPRDWVTIAAVPLTPNGKVDDRALPRPQAPAAGVSSAAVPRSSTERALAAIWSEVLGRTRVSLDDDFFALGGHSLLAAKVVFRIQQALGVSIPIRVVFDSPTVAGLASAVEAAVAAPVEAPPDRIGRSRRRLAPGGQPGGSGPR
jgi:amino acid adenylation domain-containing protein